MDFNFELILTVAFFVTGIFWLANRFLIKQEEGVVEFFGSLAPVLLLVLLLRSFLVEPFQIPSRSMVPTLKVGDFILVSKWNYGIRLPVLRTKLFDVGQPQRGDATRRPRHLPWPKMTSPENLETSFCPKQSSAIHRHCRFATQP